MAVRINRVYTRTGDDGLTGLVGGKRVAKSHPRIDAYGDVDELNSVVGLARSLLPEAGTPGSPGAELDAALAYVQQELFDLGSELATPREDEYEGMLRVGAEHVERLEGMIDDLQPDLPALDSFVLPAGGPAGAALHVARTVCRRAERKATALAAEQETSAWVARYLNRLSDLLFVQARWIAAKTGHAETLWQNGLEAPARRSAGRKAAAKSGGRKR